MSIAHPSQHTRVSPAPFLLCLLGAICLQAGALSILFAQGSEIDPRDPSLSSIDRPPLPENLSLPEAMRLAVEHSPRITSARAAIEEQTGVLIAAKATRRPRISGEIDYSATDSNRVEAFGGLETPIDQSWLAEVTLSYTIYGGGVPSASIRAAEANRQAATDAMRASVNDTLLDIAHRYFDALLAEEQIAVQLAAIEVLEDQLVDARNRFEAGTVQQFIVLQAEVALANSRPALINARSARRLAVDQLRQAIGLDYPKGMEADAISLTSDWPERPDRVDLHQSLGKALFNRPEMAEALAQLRASEEERNITVGQARPSVVASAGYGLQSRSYTDSVMDSPLHGWRAGVGVSIPLFDLGTQRGRVIQADARIRQIEQNARLQQLTIEGEVRKAWLALQEQAEILETSSLVVDQATEALRLARESFEAGAATQLDVLQSQLELTRSRSTEIEAQHGYHSALAELRRSIGETP